jgi:hypothetical protein
MENGPNGPDQKAVVVAGGDDDADGGRVDDLSP